MGHIESGVCRTRIVLLTVGVLVACGQGTAPRRLCAAETGQAEKLNALIAQLTSGDRAAVKQASLELSAMGELAVRKLIPLLRHESRDTRAAACFAIGMVAKQDPPPRRALALAVAPLVRALADRDRTVAMAASNTLVQIGPPALRQIIPALRHKEAAVRLEAGTAFGRIVNEPDMPRMDLRAAIPSLTVMMKEDDHKLRANAVRALAVVDSRNRVKVLLAALGAPEALVRNMAAGTVAQQADGPWGAQLRDKRIVDRLIECLQDKQLYIAYNAASALGKIGDPRAIGPLTTASKEGKSAVRRNAAQALARLTDPKGTSGGAKAPDPETTTTRPPASAQRVTTLLAQIIRRFVVTRVSLKDALQALSEQSNLCILTDWPALAKLGITPSMPVTARTSKVRVSAIFRAILSDATGGRVQLQFGEVGGLVVVSSANGLATITKARQAEQVSRQQAGAADQAVWRRLDTMPTKASFQDTPLKDVVAFLRDLCGVSIAIDWKALAALGVEPTSVVSVDLRGVTARTVLWAVFVNFEKTRDLTVTVRNGTVHLAKAGTVLAPSPAGTAGPTPAPEDPIPPKPSANEGAAGKMLRLADLYRTNKKTVKAAELYRKILDQYPDTQAAAKARAHLAVLPSR